MVAEDVDRRHTRVEDFRIYSVHGGRGPAVVLLHGLSGSHRWWRYTFPELSREFRVHVPELVGFGASRPAPRQPSIPQMAELLVSWMDLQGIERTHLVGHSMGGQIAIHIATRWPERLDRLVLVSAAGISRGRTLGELARFLAELVPPRSWGRPGFIPTIARDAFQAGPLVLLRATRHILGDDVRPLLGRIVHPTLLVWGRLDPLTPLSHGWQMADAIPHSRLVVLPDAAHNPMADTPVRFNEVVGTFLRTGG